MSGGQPDSSPSWDDVSQAYEEEQPYWSRYVPTPPTPPRARVGMVRLMRMTPDHGELYNDGDSSGDSASAAAVARVGSPEVERASPPRERTTECKDVVPEQSAFPEESKVADDVVDGQPAEVEEPIKWSSLSAPADFTDISPPPSDKS